GQSISTHANMLHFVPVTGVVLGSGTRAVALTTYLKGALMIIVVIGLTVLIPFHYRGGLDFGANEILVSMPEMLSVQPGEVGIPWVVSSMAISIIGVMFYARPHTWPARRSGGSEKVVGPQLT